MEMFSNKEKKSMYRTLLIGALLVVGGCQQAEQADTSSAPAPNADLASLTEVSFHVPGML